MTKDRQILIGTVALLGLGLIALQFKKAPVASATRESAEANEIPPVARVQAIVAEIRSTDRPVLAEREVAAEPKEPDPSWLIPRKGVAMPLVFQQLDAEHLHLNQQQIEVIEQLRARFIEEIGGTNQSPDDPAYLQKWQKAQPESDALLWVQLGKDIYQEAQLQAFASASFASRGE